MCKCARTIKDIQIRTNRIRKINGDKALPYVYVIKEWHKLIDNYKGERNPYTANGKIGNSYIFSEFKSKKISNELAMVKYGGRADSYGYQYWWRAA